MHRPMLAVAACLLLAGCGGAAPTPAPTRDVLSDIQTETAKIGADTANTEATTAAVQTDTASKRPTARPEPTDAPATEVPPTDVPPTAAPVVATVAPATEAPAVQAPVAPAKSSGVTLAQYNQLTDGMSYADAVAILGEPSQELSRSSLAGITTVMYMWNGTSLGANMNAMFQDDKLVTRAQFGLR